MKLSLTIPTFNEEKNIRIAMDSAYDFVDEVVIIDGGSTDKTVEIVKSYGDKVRVHHVDNPANFLKNKQRGIEYAKGEWIIQLDADEAISQELRKEIQEIIANEATTYSLQPTHYAGYFIPRKNWFLNRYLMKGGVYPDYVLRLYKREGAHFVLKNVHENVIVSGEVGYMKTALLHYADPDFERYLTRWNRYTTFDAGLLLKEKSKLGVGDFISYIMLKPIGWFLLTFFRHKGFQDGFPGFVFSFFSSLRFIAIYIKAWQELNKGKFG
ncbi:MAG: glycosyltransferase family 2 protein [Candidatus Roizmanbacteria bacterium]